MLRDVLKQSLDAEGSPAFSDDNNFLAIAGKPSNLNREELAKVKKLLDLMFPDK